MWTIFKSLLNFLHYYFCFMGWFFGHEACGILATPPGIEPTPPALEVEVLTTELSGKSLPYIFFICCSIIQWCPTWWTAAHQASLSLTISRSLLKLMSIESVMPSNHLILCRPLLLLPSIFPSIRVFSNESVLCIRWPKYWSFSFNISPSNEYSGLSFFKRDWLDLLAVQGTLKSLLQHHILKASILRCSAFSIVQLSLLWAPLVAQLVKISACHVGDLGSISEWERSPEEGKGCPLQYSGLENSMDCR